MTAYNFGDVILVPFPFTDHSQSKQRPAVIVSSASYHAERPDRMTQPLHLDTVPNESSEQSDAWVLQSKRVSWSTLDAR